MGASRSRCQSSAQRGCTPSDGTSRAPISHVRLTSETAGGELAGPPRPFDTDDVEPVGHDDDGAKLVALAATLRVGDVAEPVASVSPNEPIAQLGLLAYADVVVIDRLGAPLGILRAPSIAPDEGATAGEMMEGVETIEATERVSKVLGRMALRGSAVACVVSRERRVVGLVYTSHTLARLVRMVRERR